MCARAPVVTSGNVSPRAPRPVAPRPAKLFWSAFTSPLYFEIARLKDHLKERIVPTDSHLFAVAHVLGRNPVELARHVRIVCLEEGHQPAGRCALRHGVFR